MAKCMEGCTCKRHNPGPRPDWVKALISKGKMGHTPSEETRRKIGDAARGRVHSEETRRKRAESMTRHGHHSKAGRSGTYRSWDGMKQRRPDAVVERWTSFGNFLADMGERPEGATLKRIDSSKGYGPGNCRWATRPNLDPNKRGS